MDLQRPASFDEYIGQTDLKKRLSIHAKAARIQSRPMEPTLLAAPAGYGKTSLAALIAQEMGDAFEVVTMPLTTNALLEVLKRHDGTLLLDEVHRCTAKQQEDLLPLLEFGIAQSSTGKKVESGKLTIIAATTEPWNLIPPLMDRFIIKPYFAPYSDEEMAQIMDGMAKKVNLDLDPGMVSELSLAARGTPRRCRRMALAARDLDLIGESLSTEMILDLCDLAPDGLTPDHIDYMVTLKKLGGAKGLRVLSNLMGVSQSQIMILERDLITMGYVALTTSRELTKDGHARVKLEAPTSCLPDVRIAPKTAACIEWLVGILPSDQAVNIKDIEDQASAAGFSRAVLHKAKLELGVSIETIQLEGTGKKGRPPSGWKLVESNEAEGE